jgi:hypothetical protein
MNSRTTDLALSQSASAEEKAAILQNEKRLNTRAAMQAVLDPTLAGRFAKEAKADFTVGRDPTVQYPRMPATSPWACDAVGLEPPLGFSVEEMEVVGSTEEAERAAAILAATESSAATASSPPQGQSDADLPTVGSAAAGQSPIAPQVAGSPTFSKPWRRFGG